MKEINMYIRGICRNTGKYQETKEGKFVVVLEYKNKCKVFKGAELHTTSNRMLLQALIEGIKALKEPCKINVFTPAYLGFSKTNKSPNYDLLEEVNQLCFKGGHILEFNVCNVKQNELIRILKDNREV